MWAMELFAKRKRSRLSKALPNVVLSMVFNIFPDKSKRFSSVRFRKFSLSIVVMPFLLRSLELIIKCSEDRTKAKNYVTIRTTLLHWERLPRKLNFAMSNSIHYHYCSHHTAPLSSWWMSLYWCFCKCIFQGILHSNPKRKGLAIQITNATPPVSIF